MSLVKELAVEVKLEEPIRYNMGQILYKMKAHLQKHGLDVKGCIGIGRSTTTLIK